MALYGWNGWMALENVFWIGTPSSCFIGYNKSVFLFWSNAILLMGQ